MLIVLDGPNISPGASLSDALDCSAGRVIKIVMPQDWTFAPITFQSSTNNIGYNDLMRPDGREIMATVFEGTAIVGLDLPVGWLKIRSGTRDAPVAQEAIRTFAIAIDTGASAPAGNELRVRLLGGFAP